MRRCFAVLSLGLLMTLTAQAHFVLVVPDANGTSAKVIFSDSLEPDENVPISKIRNTRLTVRDASGKETAVTVKEEKTYLSLEIPGKGSRVVYGTTDYGVLQKGDTKPFALKYYPKVVVGGVTAETQKVGEALPVEILPVIANGKIRFQMTAKGKPLAETEITVLVPQSDKWEKLTTDKEGFTKAFDAKGNYAVWSRFSENAKGEGNGLKYEEIRHYATLMLNFQS